VFPTNVSASLSAKIFYIIVPEYEYMTELAVDILEKLWMSAISVYNTKFIQANTD